jgi:hypothetical protein
MDTLSKEINELRRQVSDLSQQIDQLRLQTVRETAPYYRIFVAADDGDGAWHEQIVDTDGTLINFPDGRKCDSADAPSAAVQAADLTLLQIDDGTQFRYLKIGGGGGTGTRGTLQGQVFQMVTDNQTGWGFQTLVWL